VFRRKLRGYRAAFRVETHRAAAEQLRREEPETYRQILAMAEGEAAAAAARDPDAYVALFLAAAEDEGVIGPSAAQPEPSWINAPSGAAPLCSGTERKPHPPTKTVPVEDPLEPTYRCPTCGREQRITVEQAMEALGEEELGRSLFERDREAYIRLAGDLASDSDPSQLPDALQGVVSRVIVSLVTYFDPGMRLGDKLTPLAGALGHFYTQVLAGSYLLASVEEWDEFDAREFNRLADDCLAVHGRSQTVEQEAARLVEGVSGQLDDYAALTAYVNQLPAYVRLGEFADTYALIPGDELRGLMDEDDSLREKVGWTSTLGWVSGVMLVLLEEAGRIATSEDVEALAEVSEGDEVEAEAEGVFEETPLNGDLFDEDPEHEGYWAVVAEILNSVDADEVPEITRQMSLNQIQHLLSLQGSSGFDYWVQDLAGTFCDAYFLADAEEWSLNADVTAELIEESMFAVNRSRLAVGTGEVTKSDYSTWISIVLNGLHSELDEWEPVNLYLRDEGAWERLDEWLYPTYLEQRKTEPRAGDVEQWVFANKIAWRNGIFLNLLYRLGYLSAEPGERGFQSGERPLSGMLFELDPEQYQLRATQLLGATAQAVPDVARGIYWQMIAPLVDEKLRREQANWLGDMFECGFVLCQSETWDDVDESRLARLIDEGLQRVIHEKDTRDPSVLIADPEYRIRNVSYGLAAGLPYFGGLSDYLESVGAYQRVTGFGGFMISNLAASGTMKRRVAEKLQSPLTMSFMFGVSLGLLDQLGELPEDVPPVLT
jgi:hypothetical protein